MQTSRSFRPAVVSAARLLGLILLVAGGAAPAARAGGRADWIGRFDELDRRIHQSANGAGYSSSPDSSTLAWAESYVLSSYVGMYRATRETRFLDAFVADADRVLAAATDPDGDGRLGWSTFRYSVSLVANGGFEESPWNDGAKPSGWSRWQSTERTAARTTAGPFEGKAAAVVRTDPARGWQVLEAELWNPLVRDNRRYEPGVEYELSCAARVNGAVRGRAEVYDATARAVLATIEVSATAWRAHSATFRAPAARDHVLKVRLYHMDARAAGGEAWFDEVAVKQRAAFAVHDGMIAAPLAELAAIVRAEPALDARYGPAARRYVAFVTANVLPRWEAFYRPLEGGAGVYVFPDDGSSRFPGVSLPHNQYLALGRAFLWTWAATGALAHRDRAVALGRAFRSKLIRSGEAYEWRYGDAMLPGEDADGYDFREDTSHANIDVGFVTAMDRFGLVFDRADVRRLATTFKDVMWNRSFVAPDVRGRVDGKGDFAYSTLLSEWASLSRTCGGVYRIVEAVLERDDRWSTAHAGSVMLATARLLEGAPAVVNGGFEAFALFDPSLPAGWTRWQSTGGTALRDPRSALTGSAGATVRTDPARGWQVLEQTFADYPAGAAARLRFSGRTDGGPVRGRVEVFDATAGVALGSALISGTAWTAGEVAFRAPLQGHALKVRLYHDRWNAAGTVRVDDVRVEW